MLENEEPDIPYEEALNISRASALRIYDQAIFQAKFSDLEDFDS